MEKAVLDLKSLKVTQGMNGSYSHQGVLAIDIAGHGDFKAPFTGVIKKIYPTDHEVWLESSNKVKYADGTEDYMTLLIMHDNDISNLKVGQTIKQGQAFYQEGSYGRVTGKHNHVTIGKGKFDKKAWYKNNYGQWCIVNQYDITKGLFLKDTTKIVKDGGYKWTITKDYTYTPKEPNYTGTITYQAYANGKWQSEVNKCNLLPSGYAGVKGKAIQGIRCKCQYGDLKIESHIIGGEWLSPISSKQYVKNSNDGNTYSGIIGKPIDGVKIKSTKGYVTYRVHLKNGIWLDWVDSRTNTGANSFAGILGKEIDMIQMK